MNRFWLLLCLTIPFSGCTSEKPDTSQVVATFDDQKITENQLMKRVEALPKTVQTIVSARKKDLVEDMAAEHFLLKEAIRRGLDRDADVRDLIDTAEGKIMIAKLVEKEVDGRVQVDEDQIEKYYEFHKEEFMTPLLLRASHILVKTEPEAATVKSMLDAGVDFEETARARSIDATAIRGGDLGFFQKGQFVPEFEQAVFSMEKGQVSAPVKSAFGYHIIKLNDRVEPRLRDLKSVRHLVEERLVGEQRSNAFKQLVEKLKGNAKIEIDEQALDAVSFASATPPRGGSASGGEAVQ